MILAVAGYEAEALALVLDPKASPQMLDQGTYVFPFTGHFERARPMLEKQWREQGGVLHGRNRMQNYRAEALIAASRAIAGSMLSRARIIFTGVT